MVSQARAVFFVTLSLCYKVLFPSVVCVWCVAARVCV